MRVYKVLAVMGFLMALGMLCGLCSFYFKAKKNILAAAANLRQVGNDSIVYTVEISTFIRLDTEISIGDAVPADIQMAIDDSALIRMGIPYENSLSIPVKLNVKEVLHVDTTMRLPDSLKLATWGRIPIDQKFKAYKKFNVPVSAAIPLLNQLLTAKIAGANRFISDIPVNIPVNDTIPYKLSIHIPIHERGRISLQVNQRAKVSFPQKMRIKGSIPVSIEVPIKIPVSQTPFKKYLDKTANDLIGIF